MSGRRRPRPQRHGGLSGTLRTQRHGLPRSLRTRRRRQPRSLRTRLVVSAVALIAVVCTVIGTVTTIALRSHLYEQLDDTLADAAMRATGPLNPGGVRPGPDGREKPEKWDKPLSEFVSQGPQPSGTVAAEITDGSVTEAWVGKKTKSDEGVPDVDPRPLTAPQQAVLADVPRDGEPHTVTLPDLGEYHVQYQRGENGSFYVGMPTEDVTTTLNTLVLVEVSVTLAGLIAASFAGATIVNVALRPLRKVASTATRVSELPLHTGEVTLDERVAESETDPHTEVGQVGAALNRMLDHVHGALHARQESETRVRQFVADASHELRTPLASIRGYAELTRRGREETGPDTRHALARIESEAGRMTGLVEDLLLLARLDAGRPLSYQHTDLSPLVVDAVSDARAAGREHNWRLELPDEPAVVSADVARLQQVMVNLFANARTHTPPGTTVTARVRRQGSWVCVDVQDDGQGIPPDLLPHVFERFARGDSSRSRASGSTGLGLAIVQAVVTAHGGAVTVGSVPGRTVFTVHLPAPEPRAPRSHEAFVSASGPSPRSPSPHSPSPRSPSPRSLPPYAPSSHSQVQHSTTTWVRQGA